MALHHLFSVGFGERGKSREPGIKPLRAD